MKEIDLSLLHSSATDKIEIDEFYDIPSDYYEDTDVKSLENVHAMGCITRETDDVYYVDIDVEGTMVLQDSISLEDVNYPFSTHIEGNLEEFVTNLENSLDILEFLWENIVLEIPSRVVKDDAHIKTEGDGWCLTSEEDYESSKDNKLSDLKELLEIDPVTSAKDRAFLGGFYLYLTRKGEHGQEDGKKK